MIPYWQLRQFHAGPFVISVQLLLAAAGILVAHFLLLRRARRQGLNAETAAAMSLAMVLTGLAGAYWFRGVYYADAVKHDWHFLIGLQPGAASFGGITFGLLGGSIYLAARRLAQGERLRYLDALAFVFPSGWIIGRIGCALAHDHPGVPTTSPLGVRFPDTGRFDLGLLEVLYLAVILIPLFALLDRQKRPAGFWLGTFLALYGAFRLWLDTLHTDPPKYGPFTVDQWAYGIVLLIGIAILIPRLTAGWNRRNSH